MNQSTFKNLILALILVVFGDMKYLEAQSQCSSGIAGIWEEELDAFSALLVGKKVYKFFEGGNVEIWQYDYDEEGYIILGHGKYSVDNQSIPARIIFSNLSVLIFQTEGSFAFPIVKLDNSTFEWQGMFGIITRLQKINNIPNIVVSTKHQNKDYYVDVEICNSNAFVWLRTNKDMCSKDDIKVLTIAISLPTYESAMGLICRNKKYYEATKTAVGCMSAVATGACALSLVPSGGTSALLCQASLVYAYDKGIADCIVGFSNTLAEVLAYNEADPIVVAAIKAGVSPAKMIDVFSAAIDKACEDVK